MIRAGGITLEYNNKNKNPNNRSRTGRMITILVWALIIGMMLFMVTNGCSPSQIKQINFDEFSEAYRKDNIKAVYEVLDGGTFYGLYRTSDADATNLPDKADFVLYMSNESFHENMKTLVSLQSGKERETVLPSDYGFVMDSALPEGTPAFLVLLPYLIEFLLFGFLIFFFIRQQGGGQQMMNFSKANARTLDPNNTPVTFDDVAGLVEEKEELQEVVEFMRAPKRFSEMGARIPKGVLLVGPPGTGKTLMAKAVAGEAKVPFFSISGSDFVEMFVGVGASRVRDLFTTAKRSAPAVVFIDEIDAVGRQRGAGLGGGHDEREQTLNQLLVEMDGFAPNEGIIVIAATNRPDILDPALLRPGRFDRRITVGYPDVKGREDILRVHARNKKFAPDIDLKTLARRTPYFTGADLENVLNEAAILATRANRKWITQQDLEEAVTRVQIGPEKKSRVVTPQDNRLTAYHESGHAILAIELEHCDKLHEVSIISRGFAAGYTMTLPKEDLHHTLKSQLLDQICMTMGGRVAEKVIFTDVSTGAIQDLKQASETARKMVEEYGMSDAVGPVFVGGDTEVFIAKDWGHSKNYSEALSAKIDIEIRRILEEQFERAENILRANKEGLIAVSEMLIKYERVTGDQFEAVYRGADADEVMQGKTTMQPEADSSEKPETEIGEADKEVEPSVSEKAEE